MATGMRQFEDGILDYLDAEEMESVKEVLVYLLMENTPMATDEVYSIVFHEGNKITWH